MKLLFPLAILCSASSFADTETPAPPVPPTQESVTTQPKGVITPTVAPRTQNGMDLVIDASFTWWKPQMTGLSFAEINGNTKSPQAQFEAGFKVGVGMDLGFDGWDTYLGYTWVSAPWTTASTSSNSTSNFSTYIRKTPLSGILKVMPIEETLCSKKLQFNIVDIELGRNFFISKRLTLRPNFGVKLARMFDKIDLHEDALASSDTTDLSFHQSLSGVGTRAGLNTVWHIGYDFGLYGDIFCTALWSNFHNTASSSISIKNVVTNTSLKTTTQTIIPVIEAGIGVTYMLWFHKEAYQFYAKAGWEEQVWIDYNHININGTPNNTGTLSMQGLTVKAGLAF